jgi:hypothetical protein
MSLLELCAPVYLPAPRQNSIGAPPEFHSCNNVTPPHCNFALFEVGPIFANAPRHRDFSYKRDGEEPEIGHRYFVARVAQISRGNAQANAVNSTDLAWSDWFGTKSTVV